ncbi:pq loop repeat protein [Colletotrichum kahawae]|uniref:Pq loop repeat protein n=1 Tax=Colletotrichum kahawae TaxID=34407 RepID=A0AAD9Y545_COLKA|nr:pq loop repeat protein [Colletotrichum kahawae]
MDIPAAANALGTLGAVSLLVNPGPFNLSSSPAAARLTSHQLIPQIIINYRRHNATGLQPSMMMLWAWAGVPLGVYNIVEDFNIALRIQPQILTFLSLATWIQCYYYERNWSVLRSLAVVTPIAAVMAGIQVALVFALRIPKSRGTEWPMIVMAVLSAALLAAGVLRHYWDIYVHRTVRGISFIFVAIDAAGDVFSLASIFFQPSVDILGVIIYATEFVLWCGVFACGGYYNFLPWFRKKMLAREQAGGANPAEVTADQDVSPGNQIALHDMPSSTSVFRTASGEDSGLRPRAIASRHNQIDVID